MPRLGSRYLPLTTLQWTLQSILCRLSTVPASQSLHPCCQTQFPVSDKLCSTTRLRSGNVGTIDSRKLRLRNQSGAEAAENMENLPRRCSRASHQDVRTAIPQAFPGQSQTCRLVGHRQLVRCQLSLLPVHWIVIDDAILWQVDRLITNCTDWPPLQRRYSDGVLGTSLDVLTF